MENWDEAQKAVLERLDRVRQHVENQDAGAAVALVNQQDAFCEAAATRRSSTVPPSQEPQCSFCEGTLQSTGCADRLASLNKAVLDERWDEAEALVDEYAVWVKSLSF